jgi:tetratricopeptide (TPR) repeat protein
MRFAFLLPAFLFLLALSPLPAAEEKKPGKASDTERPTATPPGNLAIPEDLPDDAKKSLTEAVKAFHAVRAASGQGKLMNQAITKLKSASGKAPKSALPLYYLGILYQWKRNFPEARRTLERAVKLNPGFHEAHVELAGVHVWQKDVKGSLAVYDRAIEIQPTYIPAIDNKATALIRLGEFKEARAQVLKAQELQPDKRRAKIERQLDSEIRGPKWKTTFTCETENYRVLTSVSQEFADEIAKSAELIRRAYNKVFPDIDRSDRKYAILVYESQYAYNMSGPPGNSGGYYDPLFQKLVLYKAESEKQTLETLRHEAFHQYLHDYVEIAPSWFNEGLGDYFASFEYIRQGKKENMVCRPNVTRLASIQVAIDQKLCPPVATLLSMSQDEMYETRMMNTHYSQAWSLIYFMIEANRQEYRSLLVSYFRALQKGLDIDEAYKTTFGRIDMEKFETAWKTYIKGLSANPKGG